MSQELAGGRDLTSVELFTGAGGLALALEETGRVEHRLAVEIDRRACDTLRLNSAYDVQPDLNADPHRVPRWPLRQADIHGEDFRSLTGQIDIVAGGVPCQPWSLGGAHRGFDDPRNLWPELFRTVRETRPRAVIAENVKGLLRAGFKPYYDYILDSLAVPFEEPRANEDWRDHHARLRRIIDTGAGPADERYSVKYQLLNAADYGVPQQRWRVFVVAFRCDLALEGWRFPQQTHSEALLAAAQADGSYWSEHGLRPSAALSQTVPLAIPASADMARWRTLRDAIADLPEPLGHRVEHPDWLHHYGWDGARMYPGHTPNLLDRPAKTVKAGVHGVPGGESVVLLDDGTIRYMTVRETARVMTFPDTWKLAGPRGEQMRQLGNAVPVRLGAVIADSVVAALTAAIAPEPKQCWRLEVPGDHEWKAPAGRSKAESGQEQDDAAGGRSQRQIVMASGKTATASVELKRNQKGRRIYANLRVWDGRRTITRYIGEVDEGSRLANLKAAWLQIKSDNLIKRTLEPDGEPLRPH